MEQTGQSESRITAEVAPRVATADEVLAYLTRHPGFLADNPELFDLLTPPAPQHGVGVVDMQQFMLQRLQSELARLKSQQRALISTSRSNLNSQTRIHAAVLALVGATSFEQLIQTVTTDLAVLLDVDVVTLCVESDTGPLPRPPLPGVQLLPSGEVDRLLGADKDALLEDQVRGDPALFGSGAGLVHSEALLRLSIGSHAPAGILALGSRKPHKFKAGQGTELLCFLAQALEITIFQWLDLEG
ncbi:MAG TPA: DUF484 family protein [Aliidongia sp.]|nr:DUF484 family protein [Aliidongia sp.]